MKNSDHPFLPITRITQGNHNADFDAAFDDDVPVSAYTVPKDNIYYNQIFLIKECIKL